MIFAITVGWQLSKRCISVGCGVVQFFGMKLLCLCVVPLACTSPHSAGLFSKYVLCHTFSLGQVNVDSDTSQIQKKTPQHHKESKSLSFEKYWQQKYSKVHREQEWFLRNFWARWMGKDTYQTLMTRVWLLQPWWCWKARINSCKLPSDLHTHTCNEGMHRHAEAN